MISRRAAIQLGMAAGAVAATARPTFAQAPGAYGALYTAVWHPTSVSDNYILGVPYDQFRAYYDSIYQADWRLQQLSVHDQYGGRFYSAVFQPSGGDETQIYGVSYSDYRALYDQLWPQGWRLKLLSVSRNGGYSAVWHRGKYDEIQMYDQRYEVFRQKYDELFPQGWRLALLQTYDFQNSLIPTYTAVWTRGTDPEVQLYTSSSDAIKARNSDLGSQGFRLVGLTAAGLGRDNMVYSGVWRHPSPGTLPEPTVSLIGADILTFQDWYNQLGSNGFGIKLLHVEGLA